MHRRSTPLSAIIVRTAASGAASQCHRLLARLRLRQPLGLAQAVRVACTALVVTVVCATTATARAAPSVVVTIKPIHSLVSSIMQGVGEPRLLIPGSRSPHGASLKPRQAALLQDADLVFWVGPELETFLKNPIQTISKRARILALLQADPQYPPLLNRDADDFSYNQLATADDGNKTAHDHDHSHSHSHSHSQADPHFWLDPIRAASISQIIANELINVDAANATTYRANATALGIRLTALNRRISNELQDVQQEKLLVFHDAYQYLEKRFGLQIIGTITVNPEVPASAKHVQRVFDALNQQQVACVFSEPQFSTSNLTTALLARASVKLTVLDPLGASLTPGPTHYEQMLQAMADAIVSCVKS
ncbi:MAG: zinc ABC transporter substrate-binding protein [Burkholderiaceae bacterium]